MSTTVTKWELRCWPAFSGGSFTMGMFDSPEEAMAHHKRALKRYPRWKSDGGRGFFCGQPDPSKTSYTILPRTVPA